ncbi:Protein of uncharacterised function (DUF2523) [Moraxella lacunata]|uniref:Protein of uncharacterized function (DUF2523) n=1 Tax=Moraxella lacunata TaxID=477 RepID=A0A378TT71_MORLA|nr:DUF2523 family protein [Moraxella lacunata]STZ63514.1 Protein of uncharacterised function (DUF2523) [Moraxella lacunata]
MSMISLFKNLQKGWLKDVLTGAGLTLGTSAITLTMLDTAIKHLRSGLNSVSADLLGLAHIAGIDLAMSIIIGAIVARSTMQAGKLTLQKIK